MNDVKTLPDVCVCFFSIPAAAEARSVYTRMRRDWTEVAAAGVDAYGALFNSELDVNA